ncbi:Uncharacterized protein TCM_001350 [Theobroma cacao]|uniref:Uncharacterized protein n=1 Tax=Theobroma cacao TaxID=3641 RepID=A0A061DK49_THECC|nr:Uncharacterized protein TCM_001350 [Theobroma cacao]
MSRRVRYHLSFRSLEKRKVKDNFLFVSKRFDSDFCNSSGSIFKASCIHILIHIVEDDFEDC